MVLQIISFLASIFIYFSLLVGLYFYNKEVILKHKVYVKKDYLEVTMVEESISKPVLKKKIEKKIEKSKAKKEKEVLPLEAPKIKKVVSKVKKISINDLFASLDTTKYKKKKQKIVIKQTSFLKSKDYNRDANRTKIKKIELKIDKKANETKRIGEVNEYLASLSEILSLRWRDTIDSTKGSLAVVSIIIDIYGAFSFTITKFSESSIFNKKLQEFLQNQKKEKFESPKEKVSINIKFKDD